MDIPMGRKPAFIPEPYQYRLEDLKPIVNRRELQHPDCIDNYEASKILTSFISLGHVAINQGDNGAYDEWLAYTTAFVDRLQTDPDLGEPAQHYGHVARLRFYGAIYGRADMADKLHSMLSEPSSRPAVSHIVELCARHDINPNAWIERHLPDTDDKAGAWTQFFAHKRTEAKMMGRELTTEQWREPGSERVLHDILAGEIPDEGILNWGITAYRAAATMQDKLRLIEHYGGTVIRWTTLTADIPTYDKRAIYTFATEAMADPEIPHDIKMRLYNQATSWEDNLTKFDSFNSRGRLEIAKTIQTNQDIQAVFARFEKILTYEKNDSWRASHLELLTFAAAEQYAAHGNFEQSARYLSRLNSFYEWQSGLEHFLRQGGDINIARREDTVRRDFELAMQIDTPKGAGPMWDLRRLATDFLEHTMQTPDRQKAQATLLQLAEGVDDQDGRKGMKVRSLLLEQFSQRLLASDPAAMEIGPELAAQLGRNVNTLRLYELFARHGSREMAAEGWKYVTALRTSPVRCLVYHARMLLASHMLKPEPKVAHL